MGMPSAFNDADLTEINPEGGLYIDKAIHKAVIEVDEEGSEAAAATGVAIVLSASINEVFKADHPFIYVIKDDLTGQILFIGRLNDPTI
jgi:serpin B